MKDLNQEFEKLKKVIAEKLSSSMGSASIAAFLSLLENYQAEVLKNTEETALRTESLKEENDILRSISGLTDTDIRAKVLEAGAEANFLRKQLLDLKKKTDSVKKEKEELLIKIEEKKNELGSSYKQREKDKSLFSKDLEALKTRLEEMSLEIKKKKEEIEKAENAAKLKYLDFEKKLRTKANEDVVALINKIRDYCGVSSSTSQFCLERWGSIKQVLAKDVKKTGLGILEPRKKTPLAEITSDLELLNQYSHQAVDVLDNYLELSTMPRPKLDKLSWQVFFDKLKRKYFDVLVKYKIKITWPSEKKYPEFTSDEKILAEVSELLIQNSIEASLKDGEIAVSGEFSPDRVLLKFTDNGIGLKKDNRNKLFQPFFTTKPGHKGMGLYKVFKLMEVLGGGIKYEPKTPGSVFILEIPGYKLEPVKKEI